MIRSTIVETANTRRSMPRGWLLVLCAVLFVWQPLTFSVEASAALSSLAMRGALGVLELVAHGIVAAVSFAAGWALWQGSPASPLLATVAVSAGGLVGVQSLYWSVLPGNVFPSDRLPLAALGIAHAAAWLVYLRRSKRIRAMQERM
jgi:hypothetical protein